jgi:hypothetical protein
MSTETGSHRGRTKSGDTMPRANDVLVVCRHRPLSLRAVGRPSPGLSRNRRSGIESLMSVAD